jgi:hypothetical protein
MKFFNKKSKTVIANGVKQSLTETASCLAVTVKVFLETESLALKAHSFN